MTSTPSGTIPDVERVARAWHALSDEVLDAVTFGSEECNCRNFAPYALRVLELFYGRPPLEPVGLGAVVVNPLTDDVWVRAAHPALPWYDPATTSRQQWSDPTREDWYTWEELPRPLVTMSPGWTPPFAPEMAPMPKEPTGIGAVVLDGAHEPWVRTYDGLEPWAKVDSDDRQVADWEDLLPPIRIRTHGWVRR